MSCGADMMFHPANLNCDWPAAVAAVRRECVEDEGPTTTTAPAVHCNEVNPVRAHPTDCHAYYQCIRVANNELNEVSRAGDEPLGTGEGGQYAPVGAGLRF